MSGCEGCFISAKGQQAEYQTIKTQAVNYAKDQKQTVVIYKEGFEYRYCLKSVADQYGCPVLEYISQPD